MAKCLRKELLSRKMWRIRFGGWCQEESSLLTDRRSFFVSPLWRFDSRRRFLEARVGFVLRRGLGFTAALRINSERRAIASLRLRSWLAYRRASIMSIPAAVILRPASLFRRARTALVRVSHAAASKRSWTAGATLFTFCPPGPEARTKSMLIRFGSIEMSGVMRIIGLPFRQRCERQGGRRRETLPTRG
jgi:hypothetical protein